MKKEKEQFEYEVELFDKLETRWGDLYDNIVEQYKTISAKQKSEDHPNHVVLTREEHRGIVDDLIKALALSQSLIKWGNELQGSERVKWMKHMLAILIGCKDSKDFEEKLEVFRKEYDKNTGSA